MTEEAPPPPSEKPQARLVLRPRFDQGLVTLEAVLAAVPGTLVVTLLGGTLLYLFLNFLGLGFVRAGYVYGLTLVASIIGLPPLFYEIKKRALRRTACLFYDDHADFQFFRFYLTRRRGRLRYRDIEDIFQKSNPLQDRRGLTTLYFHAPAQGALLGVTAPNALPLLPIPDLRLTAADLAAVMHLVEKSQPASA